MSDLNWLQTPVDLASWKDTWTLQRYGRESQKAKDAFNLLLQSVYSNELNSQVIKSLGGFIAEKNADGLTALPLGGTMQTPHQSWYPLPLVVKAWEKLIQAAEEAPLSQTMSYDLVNLGREATSLRSWICLVKEVEEKVSMGFIINSQILKHWVFIPNVYFMLIANWCQLWALISKAADINIYIYIYIYIYTQTASFSQIEVALEVLSKDILFYDTFFCVVFLN